MTAKAEVSLSVSIDGLGCGTTCKDCFVDSVAPEVAIHIEAQEQETASTELAPTLGVETLNVGAVDTIRGIMIRSIAGDINVDTSYEEDDFNAEILIREGTSQFFCPTGVVCINNVTADEKVIFSTVVFGTQD